MFSEPNSDSESDLESPEITPEIVKKIKVEKKLTEAQIEQRANARKSKKIKNTPHKTNDFFLPNNYLIATTLIGSVGLVGYYLMKHPESYQNIQSPFSEKKKTEPVLTLEQIEAIIIKNTANLKTKEVIKEVIKEVPVQVIKEVFIKEPKKSFTDLENDRINSMFG